MSSRQELEREIRKWCREHQAEFVHEEQSPLGERYEIRWLDDPQVVRFIDIYPREANRVIVQKGIYDGAAPAAPEEQREKGPIYSRTVDQVYRTLDELKPYTDRMERSLLRPNTA